MKTTLSLCASFLLLAAANTVQAQSASVGSSRPGYYPASYEQTASAPSTRYFAQPSLGTRITSILDEEEESVMVEEVAPGLPCADGDCGMCAECCDTTSCWFGSAGALIMTRDQPNHYWLTADGTDPTQQLLSSRHARIDYGAGWEVSLGRYFGCHSAWQLTYWGLTDLDDEAFIWDGGGNLITPIDLDNVVIGGADADTFFDGAEQHGVWRTNEIHNVELNFLHMPLVCNECSRYSVTFLGGARFFRFDEGLLFGAAQTATFGTDPSTEAFLDVDVENNLFGLQVGCDARYHFRHNASLYLRPKVGLYGNHMRQRTQLYRGDLGAVGQAQPGGGNPNVDFPINSSKNDVSFLAEIDLGLRWQMSQRWAAELGYRAVAVTGIALSDAQIPFFLVDTPGIENIDSNGDLILHGARVALVFNY